MPPDCRRELRTGLPSTTTMRGHVFAAMIARALATATAPEFAHGKAFAGDTAK